MVAGTSVVWLPVSDIDRSITFYRDQLGLNELQHQDNWAQLDANGLHIGLNARESPDGHGGAVIAFQPEHGSVGRPAAARRRRRHPRRHQRTPLGPSRDLQGSRRQRPAALRAPRLNPRDPSRTRDQPRPAGEHDEPASFAHLPQRRYGGSHVRACVVRRVASENPDGEPGLFLTGLRLEIEEDLQSRSRVMRCVGAPANPAKRLAAAPPSVPDA